jgi:hypothetical protein
MQYLLMIYAYPDKGPEPGTPEHGEMMGAYFALSEEFESKGIMVSGSAIEGPDMAKTARVIDGKTEISVGPAVTTLPFLGGYYLLECEDMDEALGYAARIPTAAYGAVEVRPLMVFD